MIRSERTLRYRFVRSLMANEVKEFRAKHVMQWLRMHKASHRAFSSEVYSYVINPLIEERIITKVAKGMYQFTAEAPKLLELIRRDSYEDKLKEILDDTAKQLGIPELMHEIEQEAEGEADIKENEEWENYIAKKIKNPGL